MYCPTASLNHILEIYILSYLQPPKRVLLNNTYVAVMNIYIYIYRMGLYNFIYIYTYIGSYYTLLLYKVEQPSSSCLLSYPLFQRLLHSAYVARNIRFKRLYSRRHFSFGIVLIYGLHTNYSEVKLWKDRRFKGCIRAYIHIYIYDSHDD